MQNQGYNPNMGMGMPMGGPPMDNGMMYQQNFNQMPQGHFQGGGMYTNQFMPQGGFGLGPQMNAPGQGQFQGGFQPQMQAPNMGMAPPMEAAPATSDAPKTEEGKTNSFAAAGFKMDALKVKEFVPAGQVALTEEQFPDLLGGIGDEPKKGKGKGKKGKKGGAVAEAPKPVVEEFDESMPWKGRKSEFFVMQQAAN